MNLLDLLIVLAGLAYAIGGYRSGAVVSVCSLSGFFGGAAVGAQVAKPLGSKLADGRAQVPVAIFCVLLLATLGQLLAVFAASRIKDRVVRGRGRPVDAGVGAVLGILSVLLVSWMIAVPLASSPYPRLAAEASQSTIVRRVDDAVPDGFRNVYSSLRSFLDQSGFPPVLGDLPSTSIVGVSAPPDLSAAQRRIVTDARRSIFKIYGQAPECNRETEGSGFVYAPHRIITNAHVVAGARAVRIDTAGGLLPATVVFYNPRRDVAVLSVPALAAPALRFAAADARTGDPAVVLGFPLNGPYTVRTARVRSKGTVGGRDIYNQQSVSRDIYALRAVVREGNSGGPLLAADGSVLGMVFARALDSEDTGFALSDDEIRTDAAAGRTETSAVGTQGCTSG